MSATTDLTNRLLIEIPAQFPARVWRRNVGGGYGVAQVKSAVGALQRGDYHRALYQLTHCRPIQFGVPGEPDIDGIIQVNGYGVRLSVEVKGPGDRMRDEQRDFSLMVKKHGGIYVVVREVDATLAEIQAAAAELGHGQPETTADVGRLRGR